MLQINSQLLDQISHDLRRDQVNGRADVLDRLHLLAEKDRALVEMALKHNLTHRQVGGLLSVAPGVVTRRLHRIIRRLRDPLVVALADRTCTLPPEHRQLGIEYFLQRRSAMELAREHGLARIEVEKMLHYIRGWHRGVCARK
jgi:DNA-directed RNA polymerase specialized sigma24 family protein